MPVEHFEVGDVVYFKSGGHAMTVAQPELRLTITQVCYNKSGEVRWADVPTGTLTKTKPRDFPMAGEK